MKVRMRLLLIGHEHGCIVVGLLNGCIVVVALAGSVFERIQWISSASELSVYPLSNK